MAKKIVKHVSFTNTQKKSLIKELGYAVILYDGNHRSMPNAVRGQYKGEPAGYYLVQEDTSRPLRLLDVDTDARHEEVMRRVVDAGFTAALAREVGYRLSGVFAWVKGSDVLVEDFRSKENVRYDKNYLDEVASFIARSNHKNGYYFYADTGVINPVGYKDLQILLFDAIMENDFADLYDNGTVTNVNNNEHKPVKLPEQKDVHSHVSK